MIAPREPTLAEYKAIVDEVAIEQGLDHQEVADLLERSGVAVFDGYISDGPGFSGTVAVVIWPGGFELVTTFALGLVKEKSDAL